MSKFEKIIIPLVDDCFKMIDFTDVAGFIDSYTQDPDKPAEPCELFLVYDDNKHNEYTIDREIRFGSSKYLKRTYIKRVNNKPYLVYSFYIKPELKQFYSYGVISLSTSQKLRFLQFWTDLDSMTDFVMSNQCIHTQVRHPMPLEDIEITMEGITIQKKGEVSDETSPFFYFLQNYSEIRSSPRRASS